MVSNVKIISSRRCWEFKPDQLRLTMLTTSEAKERLLKAFEFQGIQVATPITTFGPIKRTIPPGLVCDLGVLSDSRGRPVPIRFLHMESRRIVVDVAGPSGYLDDAWLYLRDIFGEVFAPDGSPAIGEPRKILDYSEFTIELEKDISQILPANWLDVYSQFTPVGTADEAGGTALVPAVWMRLQSQDEEFQGVNAGDHRQFQLGLRAGTTPNERTLFSGAPLDSDAHQRFLTLLTEAF